MNIFLFTNKTYSNNANFSCKKLFCLRNFSKVNLTNLRCIAKKKRSFGAKKRNICAHVRASQNFSSTYDKGKILKRPNKPDKARDRGNLPKNTKTQTC